MLQHIKVNMMNEPGALTAPKSKGAVAKGLMDERLAVKRVRVETLINKGG